MAAQALMALLRRRAVGVGDPQLLPLLLLLLLVPLTK